MIDFRVIRFNTGESFLCIVQEETENTISVLFPLTIKTHSIPVSQNVLREVHSTTAFCPFSDEKNFTFRKNDLIYIKPMSDQAIPYYVEMLNRHEEQEVLAMHNLSELIAPPQEEEVRQVEDMRDEIRQKVDNLLERMSDIEEESQEPNIVLGNKTLH